MDGWIDSMMGCKWACLFGHFQVIGFVMVVIMIYEYMSTALNWNLFKGKRELTIIFL